MIHLLIRTISKRVKKIDLKTDFLNIGLKIVILVIFSYFLYQHLFIRRDIIELIDIFLINISIRNIYLFSIVLILMLFNWGAEALKFRMLVKPFEQISYLKSYKAIFSGITLAIFTPNRIGEYGGRMLFLKSSSRIKSIIVSILGSLSQIIITIIFGIAGLFFYLLWFQKFPIFLLLLIGFLGIGLIICLLFFYFNIFLFQTFLRKISLKSRFRKVVSILSVVNKFGFNQLTQLIILSALRYIIFAVQYLLLLKIYGITVSFSVGFVLIGCIYLVQMIIPAPAIAELGIRNSVALFFFTIVSENSLAIFSAATTLWLINLIIPAIFGALFILTVNIFNTAKT